MPGITFEAVDFRSGVPITVLPIKKGTGKYSTQMGRPDAISVSIDLRDPQNAALDLSSATEPMKTCIFARDDDDAVIAWGLIPREGGRDFDEDTRMLNLVATGVESSYFGETVVAPPTIRTAPLTVRNTDGFFVSNPALDTTVSGVSHGTIGKRLIEQRLAFPGAPTVFDLPPDEPGFRTQTYALPNAKMIGSALGDLTEQERGPDFAFYAERGPDGTGFRYLFRHGSEATPRLGSLVGSWSFGSPNSPVSKLKGMDAVSAGPSLGLMFAGRNSGQLLASRVLSDTLAASGYPPFDVIDNSRGDVTVQATLDSYNKENMAEANIALRDVSFTVRARATPALGQYRVGDRVNLDPPEGHPWYRESFVVRIMSISGDDESHDVKIGGVVVNA